MTKFLLDKITRKARWVASHYSEFAINDLVQEGCELVVKLKRKMGDNVPVQYLLKALDNRFSNMIRDSYAKHKIRFVDLSTLDWMTDSKVDNEFNKLEDSIDREKFIKTLKDSALIQVIRDLEFGYKPLEIAIRQRISIRKVYRQLKVIKDLREAWEK